MTKVHLTRLVLETTSPMVISSGERETGFDNALARDANGLPYIPATAIAGVWRSLATQLDAAMAERWFGSLQQRSLLRLQPGFLHNSANKPVMGLQDPVALRAEPLFTRLLQPSPHHRDRVAINDRGVAKDTAKFEQIMLPAGLRFSTTIQWTLTDAADSAALLTQWDQLLQLWADRRMAFGASTRNGLGQIKLVGLQEQLFDLAQGPSAAKALQLAARAVPTTLSKTLAAASTALVADIPLQALDNWRCGSGSVLLGKAPKSGSVALISYSEPRVEWQQHQARWQTKSPVLCGSSIKGILAHRLAFHYRRHAGIFAEQMAEESHASWQKRPDALDTLLGLVGENHEDARAGLLYVDDSSIDVKAEDTVLRTHNAIDRFTGGVMQGALFTEELLYRPKFSVRLWLRKTDSLDATLKAALADTLRDLTEGLLPMGAGSGRGSSLVALDSSRELFIHPEFQTAQQEKIA